MRPRYSLFIAAAALAVIDLAVETQILPLLYQEIPLPFPETSKPIGNALFSATSLHLALIASNLLVLTIILKKTGYEGGFLPSKKVDWLDLFALLMLVASGLAMWFYPIFMLVFICAGVYLVLTEMR